MMEKNVSSSMSTRTTLPSEKHSLSMGPTSGPEKQSLASVMEHHGSGRNSLSESLLVDSNPGNVSLMKDHVDDDVASKLARNSEDELSSLPMEQARKQSNTEESPFKSMLEPENTEKDENNTVTFQETDGKLGFFPGSSNIYQSHEIKMSALIQKNEILEGQLIAALTGQEAAEKSIFSVTKRRKEVEKRLNDTLKDMELMKEKLVLVELAQEEANSLSNVVHSDHVKLEHDVAFLKAVLDDTQKELQSTRGVLSGERARAFQLQVEVFHLKQRLQSMEN